MIWDLENLHMLICYKHISSLARCGLGSLLPLNQVVCFYCEALTFFVHLDKSCVFCNYYLQVCDICSQSDIGFHRIDAFTLISFMDGTSYFFHGWYSTFDIFFWRVISISIFILTFPPVASSINFIILCFMFRSMTHFELLFGEGYEVRI